MKVERFPTRGCDGNHADPACDDPGCWRRYPATQEEDMDGTDMNPHEALTQLLHNHNQRQLHLDNITTAWDNIALSDKVAIGKLDPQLAEAIVRATTGRDPK